MIRYERKPALFSRISFADTNARPHVVRWPVITPLYSSQQLRLASQGQKTGKLEWQKIKEGKNPSIEWKAESIIDY